MLRGGDTLKGVEKFRDIVRECTNEVCMWHETCGWAEEEGKRMVDLGSWCDSGRKESNV